jgi:hypothetical protein
MIRQRTLRRLGQFRCVPGQFAGAGQRFLPRQPVLMPALFPFGQILFADVTSAKVPGENMPYFRQAVEPFDQAVARLTILQSAVKLIAEVTREPGNFSGASHQ